MNCNKNDCDIYDICKLDNKDKYCDRTTLQDFIITTEEATKATKKIIDILAPTLAGMKEEDVIKALEKCFEK
jgi:hypothetical protein